VSDEESVERLSEVLTNLRDLSDEGRGLGGAAVLDQVDVLRDVQEKMQLQLKAHDAQIAALREVILMLSGRKE